MFEVFNIAGDYKDVMNLEELDIYGSKRMGMVQLDRMIQRVDYAGTINTSTGYGSLAAYGYTENYTMPNMTDPYIEFPRTLGQKRYELTNHLGNPDASGQVVLAVISDKKIIINISGTHYYDAEVITAQDYYAFGAPMPGRSYQLSGVGGYRYGFNGQEKDDEVKGAGDMNSAEFWEFDTRLGRRWNVDPLSKATNSPYSTFSDDPIISIDPTGASDDDQANKNQGTTIEAKATPPLKFGYALLRILNPSWWGSNGRARMEEWGQCNQKNMFARQHLHSSSSPIDCNTTIEKRTVNQPLSDISITDGSPVDKVLSTPCNGMINIQIFDDFNQTDVLLIEDATNGNGVGTDPSNVNVGNDIYSSPAVPDATNAIDLSPPIRNRQVQVVSNQTRVRVLPNINGTNSPSRYTLILNYTYVQQRTVSKCHLWGFIPLPWKTKVSDWSCSPQKNKNE